ncbi:MAG: FHA domain-containing protein [Gammaproteobacteria bacterium]
MSTAHDRPFEPEPTPLLADVPAPVAPVAGDSAAEWVGEKTILIADDEVTTIYLNVAGSDEWLSVREFPAVIGRHERAAITVDHPSVSRRHAHIAVEADGTLVVEDLGSSNGIRVEGQRVERMLLMDGDRFELGRVSLRISTQPPGEVNVAAVPAAATVAGSSGPSGYDPTFHFDLKKFLPLVVSVAAAAVALAMFVNRTPRTVVLPALPESELVAAAPVDVPFEQAKSLATPPGSRPAVSAPTDQNGSAPEQVATPAVAPANESTSRATEQAGSTASLESRSLLMDQSMANTRPLPAPKAPAATEQVEITQPLATVPQPQPEPVQQDRPVEAPFQEELAAAPKINSRPPRPAGKPKPVRRSSEFSRAYIDTALQMYLDGDSDNAIQRLGIMSRSLRNQRQFRDEAAGLQVQIEGLVSNYKQGQSALDRGDRGEAAASWARFLRDESQLFGGSTSVFAKRIGRVVAEQYIRDGDSANAEGRFHDAHLSWTKALQYEPDGVAKESLARLEQRGQELFREGYRLEGVNLERAKALWTQVTEILPPGTEYHTKARAKLRWHEQGERG